MNNKIMFKRKKIKFKELKKIFKKSPRVLAGRSFLFFLGLFFVVSVFGAAVFYYYINLTKISGEIVEKEKRLNFDAETQQKVLEEWQKRNERFLETDFKNYSDPFKPR